MSPQTKIGFRPTLIGFFKVLRHWSYWLKYSVLQS